MAVGNEYVDLDIQKQKLEQKMKNCRAYLNVMNTLKHGSMETKQKNIGAIADANVPSGLQNAMSAVLRHRAGAPNMTQLNPYKPTV